MRFKATSNLNFETRIEAGAGEGKPDISTPGWAWHEVKEKGYAFFSFIVGTYYTFPMPRIQLGVEIGAQSFTGDFQIWNSSGFWNDADVSGSGGIVNLAVGYRF